MIYENVKQLCDSNGISIRKLEQDIGLGNATIRGWQWKYPRIDTLIKVSEYFGVSLDVLTGGELPTKNVMELAEQIQKNENMKILFDDISKVSPEDLQTVADIARRMFGDKK